MMHILIDAGLLHFLEPDAIFRLSITNHEALADIGQWISRVRPVYSDWKPHQALGWFTVTKVDIVNLGVIHNDRCRLCLRKYYKYSFEEHPFMKTGIFAHAICITKSQRSQMSQMSQRSRCRYIEGE